MKKIALLIIFNLLALTIFGQIPIEDLSHPYKSDEAHYMPNVNRQFQLKQAEKLKLDSSVFELYDMDLDQWNTSAKLEYTYDDDENIVLLQHFVLDDTSQQWMPYRQYDYDYDNNGNQTLYMISDWADYFGQWIPSSKSEYTYNNAGHRISRLHSTWNIFTQQLEPYFRGEYTYDSNDHLILYQDSVWNDIAQQWELREQREYTNDSEGHLILWVYLMWNMDAQQWEPLYKYDYNHDSEGDVISYSISSWNNNGQQWNTTFSMSEYTYDSYRNLVVEIDSRRDTETQEWMPQLNYEYSYDNSYTSEDLIVHLGEVYTRHKITGYTRKVWDESTQEWLSNIRGSYHFSEQTVGIAPATEAGIEIFPNPANDIITFNLENTKPITVQLYDAQGKHLHTQALAQNNQLSVRHLESGVYFYQLMYDGEMYGGKFIVK